MATASTNTETARYGWTSTIAATTCTTDCWCMWIVTERSYTAANATDTSSVVWGNWATTAATTSDTTRRVHKPRYKPVELTPEQVAEADRLQVELAARQEEERKRLKAEADKRAAEEAAADKRAEELLLSALDAEQKAEYARDQSFHVRAPRTGRRYRIRRGWAGHVERVEGNNRLERLCIHPVSRVPLPDNQLIAKLMIESDEESFRKTANITPLAEPVGAN